jgi:transposase
MGKPIGPKKVHHYSNEFKVQAVRLSLHPDIQTQDVAKALDIHPFMLSRWKKEYREGVLKPSAQVKRPKLPPASGGEKALRALGSKVDALTRKVQAQIKRRALERKVRELEIENELLKKSIRFNLERRKRSSSS